MSEHDDAPRAGVKPLEILFCIKSLREVVGKDGRTAIQFEIKPRMGVELENDVADRVSGIRFTAIVKREEN